MSKGRPRKTGERYPSGKLKVAQTRPGAEIRRIVDLAAKKAADPIFGTPIGWLRLTGELSDLLVRAAEIYAMQRRAYDAAQGMASRSARSADMGATPRRSRAATDSADARAVRLYERTYAGMFTRLGDECARAAINVMDRVIIGLQQPSWAEIATLQAGLMAVGEENGIMGDPSRRRDDRKGVSVYPVPLNLPRLDIPAQIRPTTVITEI